MWLGQHFDPLVFATLACSRMTRRLLCRWGRGERAESCTRAGETRCILCTRLPGLNKLRAISRSNGAGERESCTSYLDPTSMSAGWLQRAIGLPADYPRIITKLNYLLHMSSQPPRILLQRHSILDHNHQNELTTTTMDPKAPREHRVAAEEL